METSIQKRVKPSIQERFEKWKVSKPGWSDYVCFFKSIYGKKYAKQEIRSNFNKMVDKEDYVVEEKNEVLKYLYLVNERVKKVGV